MNIMRIKKGIYSERAKFSEVKNMTPNVYDTNTLKCVSKFRIGSVTYIVKTINGYLCKYALCILKGRKAEPIANSDSAEFLETFAITTFAVKTPEL